MLKKKSSHGGFMTSSFSHHLTAKNLLILVVGVLAGYQFFKWKAKGKQVRRAAPMMNPGAPQMAPAAPAMTGMADPFDDAGGLSGFGGMDELACGNAPCGPCAANKAKQSMEHPASEFEFM